MNNLKKLTILYLEDEELIRTNVTEILGYMFEKVYEATNYEEALNKFTNNKIDIILSDISMSGKNGLDFVKHIRETNKSIPVILLTAHTDTKYLLEAVKLNLVDYLRKPVNFKELKDTLKKAAENCSIESDLIIEFEDQIIYNFTKKELSKENILIDITKKEMLLLDFLFKNKDRTVSKDEIQVNVWEDDFEATDSAFKSLMNKLRKKIGKNSIKNISKVGYKFNNMNS
ncbi:response regulator transcription factor [Halarcobacter bivalviorum]|uniref:response regulator transcription factor n=1 Tax=Halarcobacter bivalviorum TaxID=663364 RepID=UPI00100B9B91|nr:response regulator transcription factor [Halarcobacter bivalviorum]RXK04808.1 transcriptional regulator [Halarcobacter bivalviorum]